LLLLVERCGHTLEKDELMKRLWPDTFVEEANLTNNISILRKSLDGSPEGHEYIKTVPRRGYRFVGPVKTIVAELDSLVGDGGSGPASAARDRTQRRWDVRRLTLAVVFGFIVLAGAALYIYFSKTAPALPRFLNTEITKLTSMGKSTAAVISPDGK